MGNKGSATVELSLIMPLVLFAVIFCVYIIANVYVDALAQETGYSSIYTYIEKEKTNKAVELKNGCAFCTPENFRGLGNYTNNKVTYKTEIDKCTSRLRRWQLYGNILSK